MGNVQTKRSTSQDKASLATKGSQHAGDVFLGHLFMYSNHLTEGKRERGIKMIDRKEKGLGYNPEETALLHSVPQQRLRGKQRGEQQRHGGDDRQKQGAQGKKLCRDTWPCRAPALPSD